MVYYIIYNTFILFILVIIMIEEYYSYTYRTMLDVIDKKVTDDNEMLYLLEFEGDECYLIIGGGDCEYAELKMSLFDKKKAQKVFDLL